MRLDEFYDPSKDEWQKRSVNDTRKSKLTLRELNKLRKLCDIKTAEQKEREKFARVMYAPPPQNPGF